MIRHLLGPSSRAGAVVWMVFAFLASARPGYAESFPPITEAEKSLTSVAGSPNAAAVVLWRKGEMRMMDPASQDVSSHLVVQGRVKILKVEGADRGNIAIAHSGYVRLLSFEGRTVLPDGRVVPVPKDVRFQRTSSSSKRQYVTSVAFPAVEPGAILDYRFEVAWDSIFFLDPWFFQESDVPVVHSEINFDVPASVRAHLWSRDPMRIGIQTEKVHATRGTRVRAWADNLPAVPNEEYQPAFSDMAAQLMLVPSAFSTEDVLQELMESWPATCRLFEDSYDYALQRDGDLDDRVKTITAAATTPMAKAEALYRFVRDEIATEPRAGVGLPEKATLSDVLKQRRGDYAEKALLLHAMLRSAKLTSKMVWVADRDGGTIDLALPNPAWFDGVVVMVELDGHRVVLDPNDRALAFGHLPPGLEGTTAVLWDAKKPETAMIPESAADRNSRMGSIELTIDETGKASGKGTLTLAGASAWRRTFWKDDATQTVEAWKKELGDLLPSFTVRDVTVEEKVDDQIVFVRWTMAQKDEDVLGTEVTLSPSRPVGPASQPFPLNPPRRTAIELDYANRSQMEVRVRWPAGWKAEALPDKRQFDNAAGSVSISSAVDADGLGVVYRRRVDIAHRSAITHEQIDQMRALFQQAADSDAQSIVLAHR